MHIISKYRYLLKQFMLANLRDIILNYFCAVTIFSDRGFPKSLSLYFGHQKSPFTDLYFVEYPIKKDVCARWEQFDAYLSTRMSWL